MNKRVTYLYLLFALLFAPSFPGMAAERSAAVQGYAHPCLDFLRTDQRPVISGAELLITDENEDEDQSSPKKKYTTGQAMQPCGDTYAFDPICHRANPDLAILPGLRFNISRRVLFCCFRI